MPEFDSLYRVLRRRSEPDQRSLDSYRRAGGYSALEKAFRQQTPEQVIQQVADAKLRGRGVAGRLTGEKWRIVRRADEGQKYVICNAYDADPRAWAARSLLERNPHQVIEGIVLAAYAVGASEAYLFTRSLYHEGVAAVQQALREAVDANLVVRDGVEAFNSVGTETTSGTKVLTVYDYMPDSEPKAIEVPFGATLREIMRHAGYNRAYADLRAVVVGGADGGALPTSLLDTPFDFDPIEEAGAIVGSGVIELFPANTCMVAWAMERSRYLAKESCGKCVPCRLGVKRIEGILEGIISDLGVNADLDLLDEFAEYVPNGSLCGFGVHAPNPLKTARRYWPDHFRMHIEEQQCPTGTCVPARAHRFVTKHVLP